MISLVPLHVSLWKGLPRILAALMLWESSVDPGFPAAQEQCFSVYPNVSHSFFRIKGSGHQQWHLFPFGCRLGSALWLCWSTGHVVPTFLSPSFIPFVTLVSAFEEVVASLSLDLCFPLGGQFSYWKCKRNLFLKVECTWKLTTNIRNAQARDWLVWYLDVFFSSHICLSQ